MYFYHLNFSSHYLHSIKYLVILYFSFSHRITCTYSLIIGLIKIGVLSSKMWCVNSGCLNLSYIKTTSYMTKMPQIDPPIPSDHPSARGVRTHRQVRTSNQNKKWVLKQTHEISLLTSVEKYFLLTPLIF